MRVKAVIYLVLLMTAVLFCVAQSAQAVTVQYYTLHSIVPGTLGLNHALVAQWDDDNNGPDSTTTPPPAQVDPVTGAVTYPGAPSYDKHGNGIPDGAEFAIVDYIYATPSAPYHDQMVAALDHNREALYYWTGPEGPCAGDYRTALLDVQQCDGFGNTPPYVCFPVCSLNSSYILKFAAHATVSRYMGPDSFFAGMWAWFNGYRDLYIDFTTDPRMDRSLVDIFAEDGDIDDDGFTNLQEWQSVMRALGLHDDPAADDSWPDDATGSLPSREEKDVALSHYITYALLTQGLDPEDPNPIENPRVHIVNQSASQWIEALPGTPLHLSVTVAGGQEPITYSWLKNGLALTDGGRISGAETGALTIAATLLASDSGTYTCVVNDSEPTKRQVVSAPISIVIAPEGSLPVGGGVFLMGLALMLTAAGARSIRPNKR